MLIKSDRCPLDHKILSFGLKTGVLFVIYNTLLLDPFLAHEIHLGLFLIVAQYCVLTFYMNAWNCKTLLFPLLCNFTIVALMFFFRI